MNFFMKNHKGVALITVLLITVVVIILIGAAFTGAYMEVNQSAESEAVSKVYYLAHSAVDVMAKDIINKTNEIENLRQVIIAATTEEEFDAAFIAYQNAVEFFEQNIVPQTGSFIHSMSNITGVSTVEVISSSFGGNSIIKIKATATIDGNSAMVAAEMTAVPVSYTKEILVRSSAFDVPLHASKNITLKDKDNIVGGGTLIYGVDFDVEHGDSTGINPVMNTDPLSAWPLPDGLSLTTLPTNLNVNTTSGDVSLYFDKLKINGNGSITITGSNDLYIYVNNIDKIDGSYSIKASSPNASVYFIVLGNDDFSISGNFFSGVSSPYYKPALYWYAPYCDVTVTGSAGAFTGSIVAENVEMENNARITYKKPINNNGGPSTTKTYTIIYSNFVGGDKGLKWLN